MFELLGAFVCFAEPVFVFVELFFVFEELFTDFEDLEDEDVPSEIIDALKLLTHEEGTDYYDYVQHIIDSGNTTAINVKLNDLTHNIARGKAFGYENLVQKHEKALKIIKKSLQE